MTTSGLVRFHPDLADLLVNIDDVHQHPDNPNNGDVEAITTSIEINGMYRPIYVQKTSGAIIAGNHTWEACKTLGAEQIPVIEIDCDDTTAQRILLADNKIAALAQPDDALLLNLLENLAATDSLLGTGYRPYDMEVLRQLAQIAPDYEGDHATWPLIQIRIPPHIRDAYYSMTESAVGERERFELLMRLAGWEG
jgi:hypothetical protein